MLHCNRKLKKLIRALKENKSTSKERDEERPPQQWNQDYALVPFEGLTPEYMEMSECSFRGSQMYGPLERAAMYSEKPVFMFGYYKLIEAVSLYERRLFRFLSPSKKHHLRGRRSGK